MHDLGSSLILGMGILLTVQVLIYITFATMDFLEMWEYLGTMALTHTSWREQVMVIQGLFLIVTQ